MNSRYYFERDRKQAQLLSSRSKCPNCSTDNAKTADFCRDCGAALGSAAGVLAGGTAQNLISIT